MAHGCLLTSLTDLITKPGGAVAKDMNGWRPSRIEQDKDRGVPIALGNAYAKRTVWLGSSLKSQMNGIPHETPHYNRLRFGQAATGEFGGDAATGTPGKPVHMIAQVLGNQAVQFVTI
jgi:hypothetical protein